MKSPNQFRSSSAEEYQVNFSCDGERGMGCSSWYGDYYSYFCYCCYFSIPSIIATFHVVLRPSEAQAATVCDMVALLTF